MMMVLTPSGAVVQSANANEFLDMDPSDDPIHKSEDGSHLAPSVANYVQFLEEGLAKIKHQANLFKP
jgi:hypothetical protein